MEGQEGEAEDGEDVEDSLLAVEVFRALFRMSRMINDVTLVD
jgi:hypothetical protein